MSQLQVEAMLTAVVILGIALFVVRRSITPRLKKFINIGYLLLITAALVLTVTYAPSLLVSFAHGVIWILAVIVIIALLVLFD